MFHFSENGAIENGEVRFQLKATDNLKIIRKGRFISVEIAHLNHWMWEVVHPLILVIYDAMNDRAYWLDVQEYAEVTGIQDPTDVDEEAETVTLRVPTKNRLTVSSIDHFRKISLNRTDALLKKLFP
jgi:hypothetical protein